MIAHVGFDQGVGGLNFCIRSTPLQGGDRLMMLMMMMMTMMMMMMMTMMTMMMMMMMMLTMMGMLQGQRAGDARGGGG